MYSTMIKRFTVNDIEWRQASKKSKVVTYFVTDEKGANRKISGIAYLGWKGQIKKVKAIYKRETPLIEALLPLQKSQSVMVDFRDFNSRHKRKKNNAKRNMAYSDEVLKQHIEEVTSWLPVVLKYSLIGGVLLSLFLIYLAIKSYLIAPVS